jgi:hypothetical protein
MNLTDILRNLTGVLRYFATAVVGVCLVWTFDKDHAAIGAVVGSVWTPSGPAPWPPAWAIIGALATVGLLTYFGHRGIAHRPLLWLNRRIFGRDWPLDDNLRKARWLRKGAKDGTDQRSVQDVLDEISSGAHFFYCSGWAALVVAAFVGRAAPSLNLSCGFWWAVGLFLLVGFIADVQASKADIAAERWFREQPTRLEQ